MPYVMVPVPEEHVVEVMEFVARIVARAKAAPWDDDSLLELFLESDERVRCVLSVVARGTLAAKEVTDDDAAEFAQLTGREVRDTVRELAATASDSSRRKLMSLRQLDVTLPNGRTKTQRVIVMAPDVARMVRQAELAVQAIEPHPLDHGAG